jgi:hypothetical protein
MHERACVRDTAESGPESRHIERDLERPSPKQQPTHGPKVRLAGKSRKVTPILESTKVLYVVRARPGTRELGGFWELLNDGTIQNQEPDGREITASMKRAVINGEQVEWYETCYCSPPLRHERSTVYDRFFKDMRTEPIEAPIHLNGQSFWDYLRDSNTSERATVAVSPVSRTRYVPLRIL